MPAASPPPRPYFSLAAESVISLAQARADGRGDPSVLPTHLLEVLLEFRSVIEVLTRAGIDPTSLAATIRAWYADREEARERASVPCPPFRTSTAPTQATAIPGEALKIVFTGSFSHVASGNSVDEFALLLAVFGRERDMLGSLRRWFRRRVDPGPDAWFVSSGASWNALVEAVLDWRATRPEQRLLPLIEDPEGAFELVVHNDDKTPVAFVVEVFQRELRCSESHAHQLALEIDRVGEATVARVSEERSRALVTSIEATARTAGFPLRVSVRSPKSSR